MKTSSLMKLLWFYFKLKNFFIGRSIFIYQLVNTFVKWYRKCTIIQECNYSAKLRHYQYIWRAFLIYFSGSHVMFKFDISSWVQQGKTRHLYMSTFLFNIVELILVLIKYKQKYLSFTAGILTPRSHIGQKKFKVPIVE
jgi:hypothetical protein